VPHTTVEPELADFDHVPRGQCQTERSRMHTVWVTEPSERVRVHDVRLIDVGNRALDRGLAVIPSGSSSSRRAYASVDVPVAWASTAESRCGPMSE
jgi:hypothetical protein